MPTALERKFERYAARRAELLRRIEPPSVRQILTWDAVEQIAHYGAGGTPAGTLALLETLGVCCAEGGDGERTRVGGVAVGAGGPSCES